MALLASCWLIIEYIIIPDGFLRWFYLSFYIHPLLLFLCRIFLWLKLLQRWILLILFLPFRITCFVFSCTLRFLRCTLVFLFPFTRSTDTEVVVEVEVVDKYEIPQIRKQNQIADSHMQYDVITYEVEAKSFQVDSGYKVGSVLYVDESEMEEPSVNINGDSSLKEYSSDEVDLAVCPSSSGGSARDMETDVYLPSVCSTSSPVMEQELIGKREEEELDSFYKKYTERMRWFDVLNHDRTCGISTILNKELSIQPVDNISIPYISWSKMDRKRLLRNLESDFEMVYVAQSCLSWEALHHQYIKVEALACSTTSLNGIFYNNVAARFQKFQILLERFMEDERFQGKRCLNYVQRRSSLKSLLQVPEVSGYMEEEREGMKGEAMRATEVLNSIEKCIKAFLVYVITDEKKPWWKVNNLLWTHPPLEDPRDLKLLSYLTKTLQKKELWLKGLEGKKRCWLKRAANPLRVSQKKDVLFTMIDMKLVSRVLKMSIISTSQLKWCQEKLNNIEFKEGMIIMRAPTGPLFPSS